MRPIDLEQLKSVWQRVRDWLFPRPVPVRVRRR